jgi:hypothetical protein
MAATRPRGNVVAPGRKFAMLRDYRIDRATGLIENRVVTQITCEQYQGATARGRLPPPQ